MGAREIKAKVTNPTVYVKYNPTLVDYIDLRFNQPYKTLLKIEIIRCKFIIVWNELLRLTGTITLRDPKFYFVLQALILNLGVQMTEKLSAIKLYQSDPFISFEPGVLATPDMIKLSDSYRKLLIFYREHERQIYEINDEINLNIIEVEEVTRNSDDLLSKNNVPPIRIFPLKAKMKQNLMRLRQGQLVMATIKNIMEDIRRSLPEFIYKFYQGDEMRKIENMILNARSKNVNTPAKLAFKFINQPKLITFDDHFDAINKDKKSEREAEKILSAYYNEQDLDKILLYPLKSEPNITNIVQTIHREEESPRDVYRSVTEPREPYSQREIIGGDLSRTVQPQTTQIQRDVPLQYNRTITEPRDDYRRNFDEYENQILARKRTDLALKRDRSFEIPRRDENLRFGENRREIPVDIPRRDEDLRYGEIRREVPVEIPKRDENLRFGENRREIPVEIPKRDKNLRFGEIRREIPVEIPKRDENLRFGEDRREIPVELGRSSTERYGSNLRRFEEVPARVSQSILVERIPEVRREREFLTEIPKRDEELRFSDVRREREFPSANNRPFTERVRTEIRGENVPLRETERREEDIRFVSGLGEREITAATNRSMTGRISDIKAEKPSGAEYTGMSMEQRIIDLRRERELAEQRVNELRREKEIPADYRRASPEQGNIDIKREIAEIEKRVAEKKLLSTESRKDKDIVVEDYGRNLQIPRYKETAGIDDYIKVGPSIQKSLISESSEAKRESDLEYSRKYGEKGKLQSPKKKRRMRKIKKHKIENQENIDINKPNEEVHIRTTKVMTEEKNIPSTYHPSNEPFKSSNFKEIKAMSSRQQIYPNKEENKAEEKLNQTNNTLDIYNLYLKDIYVNPANTKTVIKSMLEIPEEDLVVTGSDSGEVRIFYFDKSLLQNKPTQIPFTENLQSSFKLLHEIKVFDSPIKSMVFLPSREYASYFGDKFIPRKNLENLKLKYYLVCACMDGHISLIDLRNFNEEKIYPHYLNQLNEDQSTKKISLLTSQTQGETALQSGDNAPFKKVIDVDKGNNIIEKQTSNQDDITIENLKVGIPFSRNIDFDTNINQNLNKVENIDFGTNENENNMLKHNKNLNLPKIIENENVENINIVSSNSLLNPNFPSEKINTVNLPIYSMVYIPNRKTVLFSQGTDIFEFNNFTPTNNNNISTVNLDQKIRILIPEAHKDEINLLYFINEKNILISCSKDNRILLWDFNDATKLDYFLSIGELAGSTSRIHSLCSGYIEGVWHIASLSKNGIINFWNLGNKEKSKTITFPFNIKSIQFFGYENIFIIIKKNNGFILFDAFDEQYKEFSNMDKINKEVISGKEIQNIPKQEVYEEKSKFVQEDIGNIKLNIHPHKKIHNLQFENLNLLSLRLMSKYTCGILVGNNLKNIENENDICYAIFSNKLGNLDVWGNFNEYEL